MSLAINLVKENHETIPSPHMTKLRETVHERFTNLFVIVGRNEWQLFTCHFKEVITQGFFRGVRGSRRFGYGLQNRDFGSVIVEQIPQESREIIGSNGLGGILERHQEILGIGP